MADADVTIAKRWFEEVWNQGRTDVMHELLAADAPVYGVGGGADVMRGPAGFLPAYQQLKGAFPDIHFTIDAAISQGDIVALRWTAQMTHTGDHLGVLPTNKPITVTGMAFARIRDGIMVEGWNNWDMLTMLHATGQIPQPAAL